MEVVVHQQRWFHPGLRQTRTDQAADLVAQGRFSTLVMFSAMLDALCRSPWAATETPARHGGHWPSRRTTQRWVRQGRRHALVLQQGVRNAWFARGPAHGVGEMPGGVFPPELTPTPRRPPRAHHELLRAFSLLLGWAMAMNTAGAPLLAMIRQSLPTSVLAR